MIKAMRKIVGSSRVHSNSAGFAHCDRYARPIRHDNVTRRGLQADTNANVGKQRTRRERIAAERRRQQAEEAAAAAEHWWVDDIGRAERQLATSQSCYCQP